MTRGKGGAMLSSEAAAGSAESFRGAVLWLIPPCYSELFSITTALGSPMVLEVAPIDSLSSTLGSGTITLSVRHWHPSWSDQAFVCSCLPKKKAHSKTPKAHYPFSGSWQKSLKSSACLEQIVPARHPGDRWAYRIPLKGQAPFSETCPQMANLPHCVFLKT